MNPAEQQMVQDRATRDAARAVFDTRLARVRAALAARSVPQRIKAEAVDRAVGGIDQAVAVAKDNRVIVAGTALALVGWFARRPLGRWGGKLATKLANRAATGEPGLVGKRLREWTAKRIRT